jgi:CDP-diacylglycerol--serine O-phosphatidyltransferase
MNLAMRLPRPPRKAAYALPTMFTAGNIFLGFVSISQTYEAAMATAAAQQGAATYFDNAAKCIGLAMALDGLDGRIARMTNTVSDFGREMDSLADVITFCMAPAVLAFVWGVYFADTAGAPFSREHFLQAGYFVSFLFLLCGALRLARFNVQANPVLKNPGRPDRKYFAGLATPAAASLVASVVYFAGGGAVTSWVGGCAWIVLIALSAFLMVSTLRYRSFKELSFQRPRSPLLILLAAASIWCIWVYSRPALVTLAGLYFGSGVVVRIAGSIRRRVRAMKAQQERRPVV